MARINVSNMMQNPLNRNTVHEVVDSTYCVFDCGTDRYFQISTYGRADRAAPGIVSQTIQFDRQSAQRLITLLKQEFNIP